MHGTKQFWLRVDAGDIAGAAHWLARKLPHPGPPSRVRQEGARRMMTVTYRRADVVQEMDAIIQGGLKTASQAVLDVLQRYYSPLIGKIDQRNVFAKAFLLEYVAARRDGTINGLLSTAAEQGRIRTSAVARKTKRAAKAKQRASGKTA